MRSNYGTLLSLTEWGEYLQLNRWLMAQFSKYRDLDNNTLKSIQRHWRASKEACDDPYFEYIYHNGKVSRDEISRAIKQAEEEFALVMGYWPAPVEITETVKYPEHYDTTKPLAGGMYTRKWEPKCLQTKWTKIQSLGVYEYELINYYNGSLADLNDDGVQETIVINGVITPLGTTCDELQVYFRDTDFPYGGEEDNTNPEPQWRIYPIEATVTSADNGNDTMTWQIRFFAWEGVLPNKQISEFPVELVANVSSNFATSFRVIRRTINTELHGALIFDKYEEDCTRELVESCFMLKENDLICPNPTLSNLCGHRFPNAVEMSYIAGCDLQKCGRMDTMCAMIVTFLSAARLACEPCGCGCNGKYPLHWYSEMYKEKMSQGDGRDIWVLGDDKEDRKNPFGPRNGDVMAWRLAKNLTQKKIHSIFP